MFTGSVAAALLAVWACSDSREQQSDQPRVDSLTIDSRAPLAVDSLTVVFTRAEAPAAVRRPVTDTASHLRTALEWLLRGPTAVEQAAGIQSWFSDKTAGALRSVDIDSSGHAIVDFQDLRGLIPNASSSAGSAVLLQELNGTVFQFPEILSVEYRMEGSCDLFWEWLQYGCQIVARPER
jgi:hypothetical protein